MSAKPNYFRVGLFVIGCTALLLAVIVVLGAGSLFRKGFMAETYFDTEVDGLVMGSIVKYRGVPVGSVSRVSFVSEKYTPPDLEARSAWGTLVLVEMELDARVLPDLDEAEVQELLRGYIERGGRARIASSGLTAPPHLQLTKVDPELYPPRDIAWEPEYLYIPSVPSVISEMQSRIQNILAKLDALDVQGLFDDARKLINDIDQSVLDLETKSLSQKLQAFLDELRGSNQRVQTILDALKEDLPEISAKLRASTERIDELLQDEAVERMLEGLAATGDNAGPAMADLRRTMRVLSNLLATEAQDLEALIANLSRISADLSAITEDTKENPSRLLFGDPPPRQKPGVKP